MTESKTVIFSADESRYETPGENKEAVWDVCIAATRMNIHARSTYINMNRAVRQRGAAERA